MKTISTLGFAILLAIGSGLFAQEEKKEKELDPSGTWRWDYDLQGETVKDHAILQKQKDGKVTGWLHSTIRDKPLEVKKGKIKGGKLTFEVVAEFDGTEVGLEFVGKLKGDELEDGQVFVETDADSMEFPWAPNRSVQMSDVVGEWELVFETTEREIEAKLVVKSKDKKFEGIHSGENIGEIEAKELKIRDNNLTYTIVADFNGNEMTGQMKGRPYGNSIKGTIDIEVDGNEFELPFTGKRKVEKKDKKDVTEIKKD